MASSKVYPDSIVIRDRGNETAKAWMGGSYRGYDNCTLSFDCKEVKFLNCGDYGYFVGQFSHISDCNLQTDFKTDVTYPVTLAIKFHGSTYKRYDFDKKADVDVEPSVPEKFAHYICKELGASTLDEAVTYGGVVKLTHSASMDDLLFDADELSEKQKARAWEHHVKLLTLAEISELTPENCKVLAALISSQPASGGGSFKKFKSPSEVVDERAEAMVKAYNLINSDLPEPVRDVADIHKALVIGGDEASEVSLRLLAILIK